MTTDIVFIAKGVKLAVTDSREFEGKFPILRTILSKSKHPPDDWRFYMTVAGVGIFLLEHNKGKIDPKDHKEINAPLIELYKDFPDGLSNLFSYLESRDKSDLNLSAAIGFWVLWNIAGEPPNEEQAVELAPALGVYLEKVVSDLATNGQ